MTKLPGKITISRTSSSHGPEYITLSLVDETSGTQCVEIHLTPQTLGLALTGLARQPCDFEWRPDKVGLKREVKDQYVPDLGGPDLSLAPFRVEGWQELSGCFGNHHRGTSGRGYNVTFERYLPATP